ncbi:hypothetical protein AAHA92_16493 [Salvia divinorum]|uniref:Cytochrome b561 domain-containing protein n=1 Tax=Salvia divinorum TaxID=28513 RepID=A0ABD1GVR0_SALDI
MGSCPQKTVLFFSVVLFILAAVSNAQNCSTFAFSNNTTATCSGGSRQRKRNVHGALNAALRSPNPVWFYIHASCQTSAYIVGVAGWGTGIKLGSDSAGVEKTAHRCIGITFFVLGTLQVLALLVKPKPNHKYRFYWNVYHHGAGYAVIILSIINVFEGLDILRPAKKWENAYIGVLIFMGACAAVLEAIVWYVVIKRRWLLNYLTT